MAFPITAFAEATEYESYILDKLAPALPETSSTHILDLREERARQHAEVVLDTITVSVVVGGKPVAVDLTPLVFGAAWKVIDVVLDMQLQEKEGPGPHSIRKKVRTAKSGNGVRREDPFPPDIWQRLLHSYANTYDLRHSLTHRGFTPHPDGSLEATPEPGHTTPPTKMTRDEVIYFLRAAQAMREALISQSLSARQAANLRFILNRLQPHHRLPPIGGREVTGDVVVQVNAEQAEDGTLFFDLTRVLSETAVRHPNGACDIEIHLDDGRIILGELEEWPADDPTIRLDRLPPGYVVS